MFPNSCPSNTAYQRSKLKTSVPTGLQPPESVLTTSNKGWSYPRSDKYTQRYGIGVNWRRQGLPLLGTVDALVLGGGARCCPRHDGICRSGRHNRRSRPAPTPERRATSGRRTQHQGMISTFTRNCSKSKAFKHRYHRYQSIQNNRLAFIVMPVYVKIAREIGCNF